jgi:integrase
MTPHLRYAMEGERTYTDTIQRLHAVIVPLVFHRNGLEIKSFYKAWRTACQRAGVPGMLLHDFRRTHVRRLVRAGVPERVAMQQTGHRSRAVFERYNIVSDSDLREV